MRYPNARAGASICRLPASSIQVKAPDSFGRGWVRGQCTPRNLLNLEPLAGALSAAALRLLEMGGELSCLSSCTEADNNAVCSRDGRDGRDRQGQY